MRRLLGGITFAVVLMTAALASAEEAGEQGRVYLVFVDATGNAYRLGQADIFLDERDVTGIPSSQVAHNKRRSVRVIDVAAGEHEFKMNFVVNGHGGSEFAYLNDYTYEGTESYSFYVEPGQTVAVWIYLKDGPPLGSWAEFHVDAHLVVLPFSPNADWKVQSNIVTWMDGVLAGRVEATDRGRIYIVFVDATENYYRLRQADFYLNGVDVTDSPRYEATRKKQPRSVRVIDVLDWEHELWIDLVVQGQGRTEFSYLNEYTFKGREFFTFDVAWGQSVVVLAHLEKYDGKPTLGPNRGPNLRLSTEVLPFSPNGDASEQDEAEAWLAGTLQVRKPDRHIVKEPRP